MSDKILPIGRFVEGVVIRAGFDAERSYGSAKIPTAWLVFRFDDKSLSDGVNGKEFRDSVRIDPKAPKLRQFCGLLHCRNILHFSEKHREKSKLNGYTKMQEHLIENIDSVVGVWNQDRKLVSGGKLIGHRVAFLINRMTAWPDPSKGSKYPNNYRFLVDRPDDEEEPIAFNMFEISHFDPRVSGEEVAKEYLPDKDDSVEEYEEEDDVQWEYKKQPAKKAVGSATEEEPPF